MVTLKTKIFYIEKHVDILVIDEENFDYDFLIGLDCIQKFHLIQNENLNITQNVRNNNNKEKQCIGTEIPGYSGSDIENKQNICYENKGVHKK